MNFKMNINTVICTALQAIVCMCCLVTSSVAMDYVFVRDPDDELIQAVRREDESLVANVLARRANVGAISAFQKTPLHYAAKQGAFDIVVLLVQSGAAVNAVSANGKTPLHYAARNGHWDVVKYLVRMGACVNAAQFDGSTPLHCAVWGRWRNIVYELMRHGANGKHIFRFFLENEAKSEHAKDRCLLCGNGLQESVALLPCGHYFDEVCAQKWFANDRLCPFGCESLGVLEDGVQAFESAGVVSDDNYDFYPVTTCNIL